MIRQWILGVVVLGLVGWRIGSSLDRNDSNEFPNRAIQIVVPYLAGGGTDTFARIIQKSLMENDRLGVPVVIINQPGGSATIGSRYVKDSRPDGYRILCHHEGIIATRLSGTVPFGAEAFEPIAQTGEIVLLMIVRADSPYRSLPELLEAAQREPNQIRIGANQGSPAYFICKQLLSEYPGAEFNFISADGSRRFSYLMGNKLEAGIFSLAEYIAFRNSDDVPADENIAAIANFGLQRHPTIADVPTSQEQGLKTSASNAYYFWAPKGTPPDVVAKLAAALGDAMNDPAVLEELDQLSLPPTFRVGQELTDHLARRVDAFEKLAVRAEAKLPNFSAWMIGIVSVLLLAVVIGQWQRPEKEIALAASVTENGGDELPMPVFNRTALVCLGILCGYLLLLELEIPFAIATPIAIFSLGATIVEWERSQLPGLAQLGIIVGLGIELVFTRIFTVPLP